MAPPKRGLWYAEPKLNGWRALIHTPSGIMWNRHGALLTIADCFRPALAVEAQEVVQGLAESGDWGAEFEGVMGTMPVVVVKEDGEML